MLGKIGRNTINFSLIFGVIDLLLIMYQSRYLFKCLFINGKKNRDNSGNSQSFSIQYRHITSY